MSRRVTYCHVRLSAVERRALELLRETIGCSSLSEAVRLALREFAERRGSWPVAAEEGKRNDDA